MSHDKHLSKTAKNFFVKKSSGSSNPSKTYVESNYKNILINNNTHFNKQQHPF